MSWRAELPRSARIGLAYDIAASLVHCLEVLALKYAITCTATALESPLGVEECGWAAITWNASDVAIRLGSSDASTWDDDLADGFRCCLSR